MNWTINQTVDLSRGYTPVVWPDALMVSGDVGAHTWRLTVLDGGAAASLAGATITGSFLRDDGATVQVTGSVLGNVASVTLTDACYAVEGKLVGTMRAVISGATVTLAAVVYTVKLLTSGDVVDPGVTYQDFTIDASPAGTYADLSALISADPDHNKIYITLDDGKWCYHNGTTWVAGGVYQAPYSITGGHFSMNINSAYFDFREKTVTIKSGTGLTYAGAAYTVPADVVLDYSEFVASWFVIVFDTISKTFSVEMFNAQTAGPGRICVGWFDGTTRHISFNGRYKIVGEGDLVSNERTISCESRNGSIGNTGNTDLVSTGNFIPCDAGEIAEIFVDRDQGPGNYYTYGYSVFDENMEIIGSHVNPTSTTTGNNILVIPSGGKYIRFVVAEYDAGGIIVPRRYDRYEGYLRVRITRRVDYEGYFNATKDAAKMVKFDFVNYTITIPSGNRFYCGDTYYDIDSDVTVVWNPTAYYYRIYFDVVTKAFTAVPGGIAQAPSTICIGSFDTATKAILFNGNYTIVGLSTGDAVSLKVADYAALFNDSDTVEPFIFFTDQHTLDEAYLDAMKAAYDEAPVGFVVSGGDWLNDSDTQGEACYKLGKIDSMMRARFDRYYLVVGNHDTNYQGIDETEVPNSGELTAETIRNLWYREQGESYYSFDGTNTTFYVLDTGLDWTAATMTARGWEQIGWLAAKLLADDAPHSAIFMHMHNYDTGLVSAIATNVTALCEAYNAKTSITLNSATYNFSGCTGVFEFIMVGHLHTDQTETLNNILIVTTKNFTAESVATYDLVLADYDARKLYTVRVGSGSDRTINLA